MNLVKDNWTKEDIKEYQEYLYSLRNPQKEEWTKNILQTSLPVLALTTPTMKEVVNEIAKGNYLSFLDFMVWDYYENTAVNGFLICKIKDFDLFKKYLDIYSAKADNWATCDLLKFNVKGNEEKFFHLSQEYIKSDMTFRRRIGMYILFDFIKYGEYYKEIYNCLDLFTEETEYYVNMMNAWLLCECFIKRRDETLEYLKRNKLNKFTINKAVQKCRDIYRVSKEDKDLLLQFKK